MKIYRHPINGSLTIWATLKNGDTAKETYYFYTLSQAKSMFRKKYPAKKRDGTGCKIVEWGYATLS